MTGVGQWGSPGWPAISASEMTRALDRTPLWFSCSVVPLVRRRGPETKWCGSAFFLTPWGLLATARHVVVDDLNEFPEGHDDEEFVLHWPPEEEMFVLLPKALNADGSLDRVGVPVPRVSVYEANSDAALLLADMSKYDPPPFWEGRVFPLCTDQPVRGQRCAALGYSDMKLGEWQLEGEALTATTTLEPRVSQGKIVEIHNRGRDRAVLPHPCFQIDTHFAGGMSGGPVVRQDGAVIGIVSTGIDLADGDEHLSYGYASLIATLYTLLVPRAVDEVSPEGRFADLVNRNEIAMHGKQTVSVVGEGKELVVTWRPMPGTLQLPNRQQAVRGEPRSRKLKHKRRRRHR